MTAALYVVITLVATVVLGLIGRFAFRARMRLV